MCSADAPLVAGRVECGQKFCWSHGAGLGCQLGEFTHGAAGQQPFRFLRYGDLTPSYARLFTEQEYGIQMAIGLRGSF